MAESRVIAYQVAYVPLCGVKATVFLSQAVYWSTRKDDGWFFKSCQEWQEETGLTRWEQEAIRTQLRDLGVLEEHRANKHGTVNYRVDTVRLAALLGSDETTLRESINVEKPHSGKTTTRENLIPQCGKTSMHNVEKPHSQPIHEITPQITTEREKPSSRRVWPSAEELETEDPETLVARLAYLAEMGPIFQFTGGTLSPTDRYDLKEMLTLWAEQDVYPTQAQMEAATAAAHAAYDASPKKGGKSFGWWKNKFGDLLSGKSPTGQALAGNATLNPDHNDVPAHQLGKVRDLSKLDRERLIHWMMNSQELPEFEERFGLHGEKKVALNGKH